MTPQPVTHWYIVLVGLHGHTTSMGNTSGVAHYVTSIGTSSGALHVTISEHGGGIFVILVFFSFLHTTYLFSNVFFG
jgi:uncharacterized membrane protein (GlpM family)